MREEGGVNNPPNKARFGSAQRLRLAHPPPQKWAAHVQKKDYAEESRVDGGHSPQ